MSVDSPFPTCYVVNTIFCIFTKDKKITMNIIYTFHELMWLFFIYSFMGWLLETITAAVKQKSFVNRGLVNAPFCILYGFSGIFITLFSEELNGIWLLIGCVILSTVFEWTAGHLIEKMYHEKWWDYSQIRFNLDGYICLSASLLWGVLGGIMMTWGNKLLLKLFNLIPSLPSKILIWSLLVTLSLDITATLIIAHGKSLHLERWKLVDNWFTNLTIRISRLIYRHVDNRIKKAYPQATPVTITKTKPKVFAYGCDFYKIFWLFMIGAFLGDITETIFCRITAGVWMSRSSVVWGPFSIVWGLAIAICTLLLYKYRQKSYTFLFLAGTFLGGAYEYICSVFTEIVFGKIFWDYSHIPFNLGGRINLLYCFFWGFAAIVWIKLLYPKLSALIEKIPINPGKFITWITVMFMCCNIIVSCMALTRSTERANAIPATHKWQQIMDQHFDDQRMMQIYPNMLNSGLFVCGPCSAADKQTA